MPDLDTPPAHPGRLHASAHWHQSTPCLSRHYTTGAMLLIAAGSVAPAFASSSSGTVGVLPTQANAVWVYDPRDANAEGHSDVTHGAFKQDISQYNRRAEAEHSITLFYSMGGSMEIYCHKRGTPEQSCRQEHLIVTYDAQSDGHRSAKAYRDRIDTDGSERAIVSPIIDGQINADYAGSMKGFNELSEAEARFFADRVSEQVCADPVISGVQFDVEPFDVESRHGQFHFYKRIASNFSGATGDFGCVEQSHPDGRFFSIFTTARRIRPDSESARNLAEIVNTHGNGYLVGALYDLGSGPPGKQTPLAEYRRLVNAEVSNMHKWAARKDIHYQHAIPAAAGYHEYERCRGPECQPLDDGPSQLDYVKTALEAIHSQPDSERFLGVTVWAWSPSVSRGSTRFYPSPPSAEVQAYLANNLGKAQ